jgi:endoglucanase
LWFGGLLVVALVFAAGVTSAVGRTAHAARHAPQARTASSYGCSDPHSFTRDPTNPLALPTAPGSNPLNGANFFVDGPAHGAAAGAVAQLLGLNPKNMPDTTSWATFQQLINTKYAGMLAGNPGLASQVHNLEKIASEPAANRFSVFSQGGSAQGIYTQAIKIFCHNMQADPGSIPILTTYFLHPATPSNHCPPPKMLRSLGPLFRQRVDAVARATANRPAVYLVELDGIGSSRCIQKVGSLKLWEADLRYEATKLASLPHTVVYLEGGYSDGNPVGYTAKVLNGAGVRHIQGFWTNDTHLNWTINEIQWGEKISRKTHGAHFVINTAQNGNGPLRNSHPTKQGNEDNCNPPGRGLGPPPTTATGYPNVDAFLWSSPPGNSGGSCNGGTPSGTFWAARAIQLAADANDRLGPNFPSKPY